MQGGGGNTKCSQGLGLTWSPRARGNSWVSDIQWSLAATVGDATQWPPQGVVEARHLSASVAAGCIQETVTARVGRLSGNGPSSLTEGMGFDFGGAQSAPDAVSLDQSKTRVWTPFKSVSQVWHLNFPALLVGQVVGS